MRNSEVVRWARRELEALVRLSPWIVVSLLLAAGVWRVDLSATSGLFQSPATATATAQPATSTPTQAPTLAPTAAPSATTEPTESPEPTVAPTEPLPTATEVPTETPAPVAPAGVQVTDTPVPAATEESADQEAEPDSEAEGASEDPNLEFDWGELFDALALGASYLWLGCGILLLLLLPFLFIALWVASNRRKQQEE